MKQVHHGRHQNNAASDTQETHQGSQEKSECQNRKNQHVGSVRILSEKKQSRMPVILLRVRTNSNALLADRPKSLRPIETIQSALSGRAKETDMMAMSFVPPGRRPAYELSTIRGALSISWLPSENPSSLKAAS
jgi:hypothetical protein